MIRSRANCWCGSVPVEYPLKNSGGRRIWGRRLHLDVREVDVARRVQSEVGGAYGVIVTAVSLTAVREAIDMTRRGLVSLSACRRVRFPSHIFDVVLKRLTYGGLWSALVRTSRRRFRLAPNRAYGPASKHNRWKR